MQQVIEKPRSALKPDPNNPRTKVDPDYITRLTADIKVRGIVVPLIIRPDDFIIDGWCRWLAAQHAGLDKLPCIVTTQHLLPGQILAMQMATAIHRSDLTSYEKFQACVRLRTLNPTWQQKDIGLALSLSDSMIGKLLSPEKCSAAWQEALKSGEVGISECHAASQLPESDQATLLAFKKSGANRDAVVQAGQRKRRNGSGTATVKMLRVPIAMPGGASVVVSGDDLGMSEVVELLAETLKEARRAAETFDIKTWVRMMKDKAGR